jgi:HEAT repeat protein
VHRVATLLLFAGAALGGDLRDRLDAGRAEDPKAAADAIGAALDAAPGEAAEAIAPAHWPLLDTLANRPDCAGTVQRLLRRAYAPAAPQPPAAVPPVDALVKVAVLDEDYVTRFDAATKLRECYGERAVPCLVPYLRSDAEAMLNAHMVLMSRIGRDAVLPLAAAALTKDESVRLCVAIELSVIGDARAAPVLMELREAEQNQGGKPSPVARAAEKLLARHQAWAGDGKALGAYRRLGRLYFEGDRSVARFPRGQPTLVWTLAGDNVAPLPVAPHLYFIELGKRAAQDALRLRPGDEEALALLKRLLQSEELAERLVKALGK